MGDERFKKDVIVLSPDSSLQEALHIFSHFKISHGPVVENKKLVGLVSKTKLIDHINQAGLQQESRTIVDYLTSEKVSNVMHKNVTQLPVESKMSAILDAMIGNEVGSIVLTKDNQIKGIVTETDIVGFFREELKNNLKDSDDDPDFIDRLSLWLYDKGLIAVSKALGDIGI